MINIKIERSDSKNIVEIKNLVREAFYRKDKDKDFNEWNFVEKVQFDKGFIPELSLIAKNKDEIVGYILLSKGFIGNEEGLTLGPIAVKPSYQNKGIGKKLIDFGLEKAKESDYNWVALTGGNYYNQFGFEQALKYNILIDEGHLENNYLKILFLNKNINLSGNIKFCDSFYNERGDLL